MLQLLQAHLVYMAYLICICATARVNYRRRVCLSNLPISQDAGTDWESTDEQCGHYHMVGERDPIAIDPHATTGPAVSVDVMEACHRPLGLQVQVQDRHRPTLDKLTNKCVTVGDDTKGAARRSPKYIRKTKNTLWNAVMCLVERWNKWCLITEILRRAAFTHKISLKSALSYGDSLNNF